MEEKFIIDGETLVKYEGGGDVVLPESVRVVSTHAFENNRAIVSIDLRNAVEIGEEAFVSCDGLKDVKAKNVTTVGKGAFGNCGGLTSVELGAVATIGDSAFGSCRRLRRITGCENLEYIGSCAFGSCNDLREFTVPSGVKKLNEYVFSGCVGLKRVTLSEGLERIAKGAFFACEHLRTVTVPSTVREIERDAFDRCYVAAVCNKSALDIIAGKGRHGGIALNAATVYSPSDVGTETIDGYVFCRNDATGTGCLVDYEGDATELVLPRGYRGEKYEIYRLAFDSADITSVDFGDGVTAIGNLAFYNCTNLKRVKCGNGLKRVDRLAFKLCEALEAIELPDGVEIIGAGAFAHCGIEYLVIGRGIETVRSNILYGCGSLKKIYFRGELGELLRAWEIASREWLEKYVCFYSEAAPHPDSACKYWHYVDGKIVEY